MAYLMNIIENIQRYSILSYFEDAMDHIREVSFNKIKIIATVAVIIIIGCTEPFEPQTSEAFESTLVVEATITNEMKHQRVFMTRTFTFEQENPLPESNANVRVVGGGVTFTFSETSPGIYESPHAFAAQANTIYQLLITTQSDRTYSSTEIVLTGATQIEELRAERIINDDGEDGIAILVNSLDPTGSSVNYRYEFEETFKIIAPLWTQEDLTEAPLNEATQPCDVKVVPDARSEEVCYTTEISNEIILANTSKLVEDRVSNFMVRFINRNNYIISHRYSILVRQFVQSNEAFTFYETLNDLSRNESLFSETQPGFLAGNVSSTDNANEKVLGYFEVSSVSERRIFFDYEDFYLGEDLPPYVSPCTQNAPVISRGSPPVCVLSALVNENSVRYIDVNMRPGPMEGPFLVVPRVCGDCTAIGSPEAPEFWTDE